MTKLSFLLMATFAPFPASRAATADENFYRGKTIRIIVGFAAGGGFDAYARIIARHMPGATFRATLRSLSTT